MTDPAHYQLLGHLLGALDDDEQSGVEARLDCDAELREKLVEWRRRLAPLEAARPEFDPPPGLAEQTCRYVAAWMPAPKVSQQGERRQKIGGRQTSPTRGTVFGWLNVAIAILVLVATGVMLLPAIDGSRIGYLAGNDRLTSASRFAARWLRNQPLLDQRRTPSHGDWLATRGQSLILVRAAVIPDLGTPLPLTTTTPGTWRNGTTNGWQPLLPHADLPLLADAPSANLPGNAASSRVGFLPVGVSLETSASVITHNDDFAPRHITAPVIFVSGR
jgi:hypothetical protein